MSSFLLDVDDEDLFGSFFGIDDDGLTDCLPVVVVDDDIPPGVVFLGGSSDLDIDLIAPLGNSDFLPIAGFAGGNADDVIFLPSDSLLDGA